MNGLDFAERVLEGVGPARCGYSEGAQLGNKLAQRLDGVGGDLIRGVEQRQAGNT